jgi:hypothetical protein
LSKVTNVLLAAIRDGIVSECTQATYLKESLCFLLLLFRNELTCTTALFTNGLHGYFENSPVGVTDRQFWTINCESFGEFFASAIQRP